MPERTIDERLEVIVRWQEAQKHNMDRLMEIMQLVAERHLNLVEAHNRLADAHVRLAENMNRLEESHAKLAEAFALLARFLAGGGTNGKG